MARRIVDISMALDTAGRACRDRARTVPLAADEIDDPYDLTMIARVNGVEWGRGSSRDMYHRFEALIAHISRSETLHAGEVIGSGTVGDGCGLEHGRFLEPGDVVELEISGLGVLRNRLVKK